MTSLFTFHHNDRELRPTTFSIYLGMAKMNRLDNV